MPDGTCKLSPDRKMQTEVVVSEDNIDENELFVLESVHLGTQVKYIVDFAPVNGSKGYGER